MATERELKNAIKSDRQEQEKIVKDLKQFRRERCGWKDIKAEGGYAVVSKLMHKVEFIIFQSFHQRIHLRRALYDMINKYNKIEDESDLVETLMDENFNLKMKQDKLLRRIRELEKGGSDPTQ